MFLGLLALGDIAQNNSQDFFTAYPGFGNRGYRRECITILFKTTELRPLIRPLSHGSRGGKISDMLFVPFAKLLRDEHFYRLAENFVPLVAEDSLRTCVEYHDLLGFINRNYGIGRRFDNAGEAGVTFAQRFFSLLAPGDVDDVAKIMADFACCISQDNRVVSKPNQPLSRLSPGMHHHSF